MRLNINLATTQYQDLGRFVRRWVPAVAVFAVASCVFAGWAWHQFEAGRGISRQISQTREQIQQFDQQKAAATKILNDPANKQTADTSHFLNLLIAKKSFSWTRAFMEMEQIMPDRLHVVSMTPELTATNQLRLLIRVAGDSHDKAVELVRRLEKSPSFRTAELRSEAMLPPELAKNGDTVEFEISAIYVPPVPHAASQVRRSATSEDEAAEGAPKTTKPSAKEAKP